MAHTYPFDGYTLFAPMRSNITYLIDNSGEVIHTWETNYIPDLSVYLLENGSILRTAPGLVQKIDWNGTVVWEYEYAEYSSNQYLRHHDIEPLPNGNVLMIAWDIKTGEEAIDKGRNPDLLADQFWPDSVVEIEPNGTSEGSIIWEWHVWDHLIQDFDPLAENYGVVANHPELIDINANGRPVVDWNHFNSIDYNEDFDQILLSVNAFKEIWVIDHSTTTEEAASHAGGNSGKGGDILYRWGNPQNYRAGDANDQKFFQQHDAQWIKPGFPREGNILVFNNGRGRPGGSYSSVDEIVPSFDGNNSYFLTPGLAYGPEEQMWIYTAEIVTDLYSQRISGAQRLPNGNTLICSGQDGWFFEVTQEKEIVWEYINPFPDETGNNVFKIRRYGRDFPDLLGLIRPHDVAICNVTVDKTTMMQGEELSIVSTVENQGSFTETFNVTVFANTTQIGKETVSNLGNGTNRVLNFTWNTSGIAESNYTISVSADVVANETDTLDNTFTYGDVYVEVLSHDVAVIDVTIFKTVVGQGYLTFVNSTIKNQGDFIEITNATLYVNTTIIQAISQIILTSGNSIIISFTWNTTSFSYGNYTVSIALDPVLNESDIDDNILAAFQEVCVTIPGDVDADHDVDIFDIVLIAGCYGSSKGDPEYIANCDIDGDEDVDIFDIVAATGHYGESW